MTSSSIRHRQVNAVLIGSSRGGTFQDEPDGFVGTVGPHHVAVRHGGPCQVPGDPFDQFVLAGDRFQFCQSPVLAGIPANPRPSDQRTDEGTSLLDRVVSARGDQHVDPVENLHQRPQ